MKCPYCRSEDIKVVDKRDVDESSIRRRRECSKCKKRFTTYEEIKPIEIIVIKRDGRRESFSVEKLKKGILLALEKRPVKEEQINKLISIVESKIRKLGKKEVESKVIGDIIINQLKKLDHVAYIRFASVYKGFNDVKSFEREIKDLKR